MIKQIVHNVRLKFDRMSDEQKKEMLNATMYYGAYFFGCAIGYKVAKDKYKVKA